MIVNYLQRQRTVPKRHISGSHVGFGLGTMYLPAELILSDDAYFTIFNAVEDSCNIYGEVNLLDPNVQSEVVKCMAPFSTNAATISDISDEDVKAAYEAKLLEVAGKVSVDESVVDAIYQALLPLPLFLVQQFITFSNTPEGAFSCAVSYRNACSTS